MHRVLDASVCNRWGVIVKFDRPADKPNTVFVDALVPCGRAAPPCAPCPALPCHAMEMPGYARVEYALETLSCEYAVSTPIHRLLGGYLCVRTV